jgi:hypothetical protein
MTVDLVVAGGVTDIDSGPEVAPAAGDAQFVTFSYASASGGEPGSGRSYSVDVEPWRLAAAVRRTERGWVASAWALNALGYGESPELAIEDLLDSIEQYLEFLRNDAPPLAPPVAHHASYVRLLDVPRGTWLASVVVDAAAVE